MEGESAPAPVTPDVAPVVPPDVAQLVDTAVDPAEPRIAEPTPPTPPTPPVRRTPAKVDTHDTPTWWLVALGIVIVGAGIVLAVELYDRYGKKS